MSDTRQSWSFQQAPVQRSFLWGVAITTLPVLSGFVISWVLARVAGARVLGTVSWVMSLATALLIVAKFGLDLAASRLASEYGVTRPGILRGLFRLGISLRLLFTGAVAIPTFLLAGPLARFFNDASLTLPIRIGAVVVVCASLYEFKENFLVGLNRLGVVYRIRLVHLVTRVALVVAAVGTGYGATLVLGGYCTAWIVAIGTYLVLLRRHLPAGADAARMEGVTRRLLLLSVPLALSAASVTVYSHMDRLMLGYFSGVEEVGQYAVARNIAEVSLFPVFAMVMMLRPALASRYAVAETRDGARIIEGALRFSLVSGVLFAGIFVALGTPLVMWVFSGSFEYAGELMVFFTGVIILRSLGAVVLPALVAAERTRAYALLTTVSAVVNFGLNFLLIPQFQARGAIAATIISYSILLVAGLREVFSIYGIRVRGRALWMAARTLLAGGVSGGLVWLSVDHVRVGWNAVLWAAGLSVVYVILILVFRVGTVSDFRGFLDNLRKSNE